MNGATCIAAAAAVGCFLAAPGGTARAVEAHGDHAAHVGAHAVPGLLGSYPGSRDASGTAWQPEAVPHGGWHGAAQGFDLMAHGYASLVFDRQGGSRGGEEWFGSNWVMLGASRDLGGGRLGLRSMLSLEPLTMGRDGYPLLLQSGETADGTEPLVDRQHPHDLLMELAASWGLPLGAAGSAFLYGGLPGEPALGPPAFMHRFSAVENPEAPLGHHWLDSTHVSFGVVTAGATWKALKAEASAFRGREPDEDRWDLERPELDSWSARLSWNPSPAWALQASHGRLESPEQLEPETDTARTTVSVMHAARLGAGLWQTTLAWGRNAKSPGATTDALLLESAVDLGGATTLFGRLERLEADELFHVGESGSGADADAGGHGHGGEVFTVWKLSVGAVREFLVVRGARLGLGASLSLPFIPAELEEAYGERPVAGMLFLRGRM